MRRLLLAVLLAAAIGAVGVGSASAELRYATCGDTIAQPGTWYVVHNCTGAGITIATSDVVLKLQGHTLNGGGSGDGIAMDTVSNVRVDGPGKFSDFQYGLNLAHVDSVRIDRVKIVGSTGHGVAVYDSSGNVFDWVVVRGSSYHGITFNGSNDNVVENVVSTGNGSNGLYLASSSGNRVLHDTLSLNGLNGLDVGDIGNGPASGNRIGHDTADGNSGVGFALESSSSGNSVTYSSAHGNAFDDGLDQTCGANTWSRNRFGSFSEGCT